MRTITTSINTQVKDEITVVEMVLKHSSEIGNCDVGKMVMILTKDGNQWMGKCKELSLNGKDVYIEPIFENLEDEEYPFSGTCFSIDSFSHYFEEYHQYVVDANVTTKTKD